MVAGREEGLEQDAEGRAGADRWVRVEGGNDGER